MRLIGNVACLLLAVMAVVVVGSVEAEVHMRLRMRAGHESVDRHNAFKTVLRNEPLTPVPAITTMAPVTTPPTNAPTPPPQPTTSAPQPANPTSPPPQPGATTSAPTPTTSTAPPTTPPTNTTSPTPPPPPKETPSVIATVTPTPSPTDNSVTSVPGGLTSFDDEESTSITQSPVLWSGVLLALILVALVSKKSHEFFIKNRHHHYIR